MKKAELEQQIKDINEKLGSLELFQGKVAETNQALDTAKIELN